jgi:hypothetical protein
MEHIEIYNPGMVVVRAWFIGFVEQEQTKEKCSHSSCGYKSGTPACPHCQNKQDHSYPSNPTKGWGHNHFLICKKHGHSKWARKTDDHGRVIEPKKKERLCPKCKKDRKFVWRNECNKCKKLFYNSKGVGGTGPVKCKQRNRFRTMSVKKMSNPEQEIHFAAIRADVFHQNDMARATVLVADLKEGKFLEGRWADNGSCIYRTEKLDTSDILNADKLVELMWQQI